MAELDTHGKSHLSDGGGKSSPYLKEEKKSNITHNPHDKVLLKVTVCLSQSVIKMAL